MTRVKTFDSTGLATSGRLYAGDLNAIQDQYADLVNYAQSHGVGLLAVGDGSLQLLKFGTGEMRLTGHVRTDGILRALGGMFAGAFTTTQRDAIPAGSRPYGLVIINSTTNRPEWNSGSDAVPAWQPIGITTIPSDSITAVELANGSVGQNELATNAVIAVKVDGTLKPSVSAAAGTEALRALGTTAATAAAGNDARLSDQRTPSDGSVTTVKIVDANVTLAKLAANSVDSSKIVDGSIALGDLAANSVDAGKIVDGSVGTAEITDGNVTLAKLAANSVDASKIVDGSVGNAELGTDSVNAVKIQDGTVGTAELADSAVTPIKALPLAFDYNAGSYTLVLTDRGKVVEQNVGSANTVTIPTDASVAFPVGTEILVFQVGAGQVTIAGAGGVTVRGTPGLKIAAQYGGATLIKRAANDWIVMGNLVP